jgi:hypothetical protein
MHNPLVAIRGSRRTTTLLSPGLSTLHTAFGLIDVASASEQLLLRGAETETGAAVRTRQALVNKAHG